jgi:hypothetical protein
MNSTQGWKITGLIATLSGILGLFLGRAGLTYYGRTYGNGAVVVNILLIIFGLGLMFPKILSRRSESEHTQKQE